MANMETMTRLFNYLVEQSDCVYAMLCSVKLQTTFPEFNLTYHPHRATGSSCTPTILKNLENQTSKISCRLELHMFMFHIDHVPLLKTLSHPRNVTYCTICKLFYPDWHPRFGSRHKWRYALSIFVLPRVIILFCL